ncbi:hypothetical protein SLEP1_g28857 [Rubroshorea leprosula]|uniref:Uncharacterized protein n=1 Tax=Rubroshorea leprosula TaxID=152421 RepID=A0AAV5K4H2_9ROSI|nr:hypothetical protein SLEP1_g28857 [Rubroshorea leprosula]
MATPSIKSGQLVTLQDLHPSSSFFEEGASLRVTGNIGGEDTQLTYRFNGRTAQPLEHPTAPGGEEPTSRCQTFPSM